MWEYAKQSHAATNGRCFKHIAHLRNSYKVNTGVFVEIEP
jgi:hypothetical protein